MYYFEFGYRKKNGDWRKLANQNLNLGYRIKKVIQNFDNEVLVSHLAQPKQTQFYQFV